MKFCTAGDGEACGGENGRTGPLPLGWNCCAMTVWKVFLVCAVHDAGATSALPANPYTHARNWRPVQYPSNMNLASLILSS